LWCPASAVGSIEGSGAICQRESDEGPEAEGSRGSRLRRFSFMSTETGLMITVVLVVAISIAMALKPDPRTISRVVW
jgi:hypothetical protein